MQSNLVSYQLRLCSQDKGGSFNLSTYGVYNLTQLFRGTQLKSIINLKSDFLVQTSVYVTNDLVTKHALDIS